MQLRPRTKRLLDMAETLQTASKKRKAKTSTSVKEKRQSKLSFDTSPKVDIEDVVGPPGWQTTYAAIRAYREIHIAPVDTLGCHALGSRHLGPKTYRFQTLIALMLSAQTKDQVTAEAMKGLREKFGLPDTNPKDEGPGVIGETIVRGEDQREGFTAWTLAKASTEEIDACIRKVGFHARKAEYIRQVSEICVKQYDGDIPDTFKGLVALPGVGPKMAFLALQAAWKKNEGIGVDTHVHRISNRLGWVHTKQPEETRQALEAFLPRDRWAATNPMLVGFGQTVCLPVRPLCAQCPVKDRCPSSSVRMIGKG